MENCNSKPVTAKLQHCTQINIRNAIVQQAEQTQTQTQTQTQITEPSHNVTTTTTTTYTKSITH